MELTPAFWEGRRVLVTGGTGFKGSWACLWLQAMGAEVTAFAVGPPTEPCLFEDARVGEGMSLIEGDVRDLDSLSAAIADRSPEIVLHMAAQPLVRRSFADPVTTYQINVLGTINVLEAVRQRDSVRVLINVTTDKVYENREWMWGYREDERLGGDDPYSNSKVCSELVTDAYRRSFLAEGGVRVATARAGNVIGGGDWGEDRLIPDILRGALAEATVPIRNPSALRPWQHVLNPVSGYLLLCERMWESHSYDGAWNFGPADEDVKPVSWIVERLDAAFDGGAGWEIDAGENPPHEAHYLKIDSSKARSVLGWRPIWDLEQALASIARWYNAIRAGEDLRELAMSEIEAFRASAAESAEVSG